MKPVLRRFAGFDLLLVGLVMLVAWTHTPLGGLGQRGVYFLRGIDFDLPPLVAVFTHEVPLSAALLGPPTNVPRAVHGGFPEPWRTAAALALTDPPPELRARLQPDADLQTALLATLDARATEDPALVLEELAIGPEPRARALSRARAAGEPHPDEWQVYRRFLSGADQLRGDAVLGPTLALATVLDLRWPLRDAYRLTSPFGTRKHPVLGTTKFHNGVDLAVPVGTPVYAAQSGTLQAVGDQGPSGRYVIIDHGHGVQTAYCHLDQLPSQPRGARVQRGDPIGLSGNTGRSTGPHLHFTLRIGGDAVDPQRFHYTEDAS